ncbi:uncharacterized protein LOC110856022 [Folsomia candida]|uniref:Uncharacterized protein n=1 Tax=Folsomia candida TaxID=158441 RepID=A0A226DMD6_FOLCA|nr:uncharacterized protein LOC110856022 [Folsomia candida]OXA46705.1 hypothetical protein Fcan01_18081 [Folsomia candida]
MGSKCVLVLVCFAMTLCSQSKIFVSGSPQPEVPAKASLYPLGDSRIQSDLLLTAAYGASQGSHGINKRATYYYVVTSTCGGFTASQCSRACGARGRACYVCGRRYCNCGNDFC